jgi:hypothetical protein
MKLKELPVSWWTMRRLERIDVKQLNAGGGALGEGSSLPVIVSLTSIPSRLKIIHLTIRSLLTQTRLPEKIILWLHQELRQKLPNSLSQLQNEVFEIRYVDLHCSHRKLIHALDEYPEKVIVTCDDDLMYGTTWLQRLYVDHLRYPNDIIAHECRQITFDDAGRPQPYDTWKTEHRVDVTDNWLMPIGYGGVLYPPKCLYNDVQNRELFLNLTPKADDLWFKAMSHLAGTTTRRSSNPGQKPIPIMGSQKVSLKSNNVREDGNFRQWSALCNHYGFMGSKKP